MGIGPLRARYESLGQIRQSSEKELILSNLMIKKIAFQKLNGFKIELYPNEENEFLGRLSKLGDLIHHPKLIVSRPARENIFSFYKQMLNYGRGRAEHFKISPKVRDLVYFVPFIFLIYLLTSLWHLFFLPLYVYILLVSCFVFINYLKQRDESLISNLPLTLLTCHFGYGIGLAVGLFRPIPNAKQSIHSHDVIRNLKDLEKNVV